MNSNVARFAIRFTGLALVPMMLAAPVHAEAPSRGERELAELLDGYVAGEPVRCLNRNQRDRLRVINDTALVFRDRNTIYVNRTNAPRFLDNFDVPVFTVFTSRFCNLDRVDFISRAGGIRGPSVVLQDFVPYTKRDGAIPEPDGMDAG